MRRIDLITGVLFLIFSAFCIFYLIPQHIVDSIPQDQVTRAALRPTFVPYIAIALFALLSLFLVLDVFRPGREDKDIDTSGQSLYQVGVVFVIVYIYTYALELVGFLVSSPFFLAILIVFFGTRNWRHFAPVSILLPVFISYLFWLGFTVILPEGSLW